MTWGDDDFGRRTLDGGLGFALLWCLAVLLLVASCAIAYANDDLVLHGKHAINITRPVSVVVVDTLPPACGRADDAENYACAVGAFGPGRCIVFVRRDKLEYVYHELQHCGGESHD